MGATKQTAKVAGVLYFAMVLLGIFSLMYVPGQLIVKGNASETANKLLAHQTLIAIDLAVGLVTLVVFLLVVLVLYQLLKDVNRQLAALMVILVLIQLPQGFVCQLFEIGALELVRGEGFLSAIEKTQREALAYLLLHLNGKGQVLLEFFWGIWLFPLGVLVYRSGFLPRFLGIWLIINGAAYVAMCKIGLFFPQYSATAFKIAYPAMMGELALTIGLLFVGFRSKPFNVPARA